MKLNKYRTKDGLVTTSLSGGREHHTYRMPVRFIEAYNYTTNYGENFHSISAIIFGTDEYWWILADNNIPMDAFGVVVATTLKLPKTIVNSDAKKFV